MTRVFAGIVTVALAATGSALADPALPLKPGVYVPGSPKDVAAFRPNCQDPAALVWTGRALTADYVYIDHVVKTEKLGPSLYRLASRTRQTDANTKKDGDLWYAEVKIVGADSFQFRQYSAREKPSDEAFNAYAFCKR